MAARPRGPAAARSRSPGRPPRRRPSPASACTWAQVMEAREEVDDTDDPGRLAQLLARNRAKQEGLVGRLSAAFKAGDMAAAVGLTHQLQYVAKLEQEIVKKLPSLED